MSMNLVAIAGVPVQGMSGKLVGTGGCGCQAVGADTPPTADQANSLRWVGLAFFGAALIGLYWMEARRHA